MKDSIVKKIEIAHSIDKVWQAITTQEEIAKWFMPNDFKAEKGHTFSFFSPDDDCAKLTCEVLNIDPYTLQYSWLVTGTDVNTTVTWDLKETENGTSITLQHSGIATYEEATAIEMFNSFSKGWTNCLNGLTNYFNQ